MDGRTDNMKTVKKPLKLLFGGGFNKTDNWCMHNDKTTCDISVVFIGNVRFYSQFYDW